MIKLFLSSDTDFSSNGEKALKAIKVNEHRETGDWHLECVFPIEYVNDLKHDNILVVETKEKGYQPFRIRNPKVNKKIEFDAYHIGFDSENYGVELATVINQNCQTMLNSIATTPFNNFTFHSDITTLRSKTVENMSLYAALAEIANHWNGTLDFDGWEIQIKSSIGQDRGVTLAYGKDIEESEIQEDWSKVVTRLKPIGNEGITIDNSWIESDISYDRPYTKIMSFDSDNVSNLEFVAGLYLDRYKFPQVNYRVKANPKQDISLGDSIEVKAKQFTIFTEVISYKYDVLRRLVIEVEFGNYRPTVRNYMAVLRADVVQLAESRARVKIDELNGQFQVVVDDLNQGISNNQTLINQTAQELQLKATTQYVDNKIAEINQASPNRVSNLPVNYEQGDIVSGTETSSNFHIRTRSFYPIRTGFVTVQIADLYEAKVVLYDSSYNYVSTTQWGDLYTFTVSAPSFFKVVVRSKTNNQITPNEIETSQLKVANESTATAWNLYFGDLTLEQQRELYNFYIVSRNGLTFDGDTSLTVDAVVLLDGVEVTELMENNQFAWTRISKDSVKDSQFNNLGITGRSLTVVQTYLDRTATYQCVFSIPETAYILTKGGDRILTKADNHYLVAIISEV